MSDEPTFGRLRAKYKMHWWSRWTRKRWYGKLDWDEWYEDVVASIICKILGHRKPKQKMYCTVCPRCYRTLDETPPTVVNVRFIDEFWDGGKNPDNPVE